MDCLYLILFSTLLDTILATIRCDQSCPDINLCRLSEINTTCIMADVPCIHDYYNRDMNQISKPRQLIISTENMWYIISWEPTNNNYVVNYSGFEVTVVTDDGKRHIFYMRILRSVVQEIVSPIFRMNCSLDFFMESINVVCVESLPKAFFLSSNSDTDPKVCFYNKRYDITPVNLQLPNNIMTRSLQNKGQSDGKYSSRSDENTNQQAGMIGAVIGSIGLIIVIIIVFTMYKFSRYNPCGSKVSREIDLQTLPYIKQEEDPCYDKTIPDCPVHGQLISGLTLQCDNCRNNIEDIQPQPTPNINGKNNELNKQSQEDSNKNVGRMCKEADKDSIISESDKKIFDINFK